MRFDYVVIGAGVMGSATAAALAEGGASVALVEQFSVGHTRGSSHGRSRIFRFSYPELYYVEMAQEALSWWRSAERRSGVSLLDVTGGLDIGEGIEQNAAALEQAGAEFTLASGAELMERFPYVAFERDVPVLYSPDSGTVAAELAVKTFVQLAVADGAELMEDARVTHLEASDGGVSVHTSDAVIQAGVVVVAAGAWAKDLLATAGIELPVWVTRETVAYFSLDVKPPTMVDWGEPLVYALPSPGQGLKAAQHIAGPRVEPDESGEPSRDSIEVISQWVARHFPTASREAHLAETCLYTNTDDQSFILERHDNIVVGSPCSGHGFKFAPLIGRRLAELAKGS